MLKKPLLLAGIGVGALLAFGALFTYVVSDGGFDTEKKLNFAMSLLDEGRWDIAGRLARELAEAGEIDEAENSKWHYTQGVSKLQSVQHDLDTPRNRQVLMDATKHLTKCEELGFPLGYQGKGRFYLGFCYFNTHQWNAAIENLQDVPSTWPKRRSDALQMKFAAHLRKQPSDYDAAKKTLDTWEAIPGISAGEASLIQLAHGELALFRGHFEECEQRISSIQEGLPAFPEAQLLRGRWRIREYANSQGAPKRQGRVASETAEILRNVMVSADSPNEVRRGAAYLVGMNLRQQGLLNEALGAFSGVRQQSPKSAEAIAAGIEEAEILLQLGSLDEAVSTVQHVLRNVDDLALFNDYWITAADLKSRLLAIGRSLRNQREYLKAIRLSGYLSLAFPQSESVRMQAETYERWGQDLLEAPPGNTLEERSDQRHRVKERFLLAAEQYEQLAGLELRSSEYPDILWRAIENFRRANELQRANTHLSDYLRSEDRTKRPRGFLALGRNYMDTAQWEQALEPLERCLIEYPTNPISYEARLLAAKAKRELNLLGESIELLKSNMGDFQLSPDSPVWQDSLFELGTTIFLRGDQLLLEARLAAEQGAELDEDTLDRSHKDFNEAVQSLAEAVSRYPKDPRYYETRFLVAKAHRMAAQMPATILDSGRSLVEARRRQLMHQRRDLLRMALEGFRSLHQAINDKEDSVSSSEKNLPIVRNCYFGEADVLFDLGLWEEAIQAYRNAASRFLNRPESLEALTQMAICHRKLGREFEAKKTLAQAEQVLRRIPPEYESHFTAYTRADRTQWKELLQWLKTWD